MTNCYMGNLEKTIKASEAQARAIRALMDAQAFLELSSELQHLAKTRLQYPMMTMQELADYLHISKSCLSHRMRRLMSVAQLYSGKQETKEDKDAEK